MSASILLSRRHKKMADEGRHLTDDSKGSERNLSAAMEEVVAHAAALLAPYGGRVEHRGHVSLYECQQELHRRGGPAPDERNKAVRMRPDGGVLFAVVGDKRYPILVAEDKVQGTNDALHAQNKKRQALGNAIERAAKNIRGAEMLFANVDVFPYLIFAAGCDFHSSETIGKRLEMMNYGYPNHHVDIGPDDAAEQVEARVAGFAEALSVAKRDGRAVASVFVKAHKWDEMPHGASHWKVSEYAKMCRRAVEQVVAHLAEKEGWAA